METSFKNNQINSLNLPDYRTVDFEPISRRQLTKALLLWFFGLLVVTTGGILWIYYSYNPYLQLVVLSLLSFIYAFQFIIIWKKQSRYGYALREKDLVYKRGFLIEQITVIPFNRVQHVSTSQGVLDRFFSIARLQLFTAGGSGSDINIPGLPPQLARQMKERIVQKVDDAR